MSHLPAISPTSNHPTVSLLPATSILPFNAAIRALADASLPFPAFSAFRSLFRAPLRPNPPTFFLLKAALVSKNPFLIQQAHAFVAKPPFFRDPSVLNGLVLAYGKAGEGVGSVPYARKAFGEMPDRRPACSWSCHISAYARYGMVEDALGLFLRMVDEGMRPEDDTMVGMVSTCTKVHGMSIERWVDILGELRGRIDRVFAGAVDTVLMYLYGKLGKVEEGRTMFDETVSNTRGTTSVVTWNCLIGAYVQNN